MNLRPYQVEIVDRIEAAIVRGERRVLMVAPTGSGKTVIASEVMRRHAERLEPAAFLAHHDELLTQAHDKLKRFGVDAGIIKSGRDRELRPQARVQVCGLQTLHARAIRTDRMKLPPASLLVIDEAHHVRSKSYQSIIQAFPDAAVLGMTATPCRGDGRGLGNVFDTIEECPSTARLIELGFLVPARIFAPPPPDLRGVRVMSTGDYDIGQLSGRMDPLVGDFVEHWLRHAERRRTIAFAVDVKHSIHLTAELCNSGVRAEHLDGTTPKLEREQILERLARGETEVVCNVGVITEGFDCPDVGCIAIARPTRSLGLFRQMTGVV